MKAAERERRIAKEELTLDRHLWDQRKKGIDALKATINDVNIEMEGEFWQMQELELHNGLLIAEMAVFREFKG